MRKIFTISVLSVLAVMGTASAATDVYAGAGTSANLNVATVNYVQDAVSDAKSLIVKSDKQTHLGGGKYTSEQTGSDYLAPTIKYMENSIAEAVADVDTSGLVQKTQIVTSAEGQAVSVDGEVVPVSMYSLAVQGGYVETEESMDSEVASVNTVAEHFVPNMAVQYKDDLFHVDTNTMQPGLYTIMVEVDDSGNKTFIWQAVQQARYRTSVGGEMPI